MAESVDEGSCGMPQKVLTCLPKEPVPVFGVIGGKGKEENTGPGSLLLAACDRPVNPDRRQTDENVSKCVASVYRLVHDSGASVWFARVASQSTLGVLGFSEGGNEHAGALGVSLTGRSFF